MELNLKRLSKAEEEAEAGFLTEELLCGGVGDGRVGATMAVGFAVWWGGWGGAPLWGS